MPLMIRKIEFPKWAHVKSGSPPSADAVTKCMKTTSNTLSLWEIENSDSMGDAILAIVSAGDHIETMDFIILDKQALASKFQLSKDFGKSPYKSFCNNHFNLSSLNNKSLYDLSEMFAEFIRGNHHIRKTEDELVDIINSGISAGKLKKEDLKEHVKKKIS